MPAATASALIQPRLAPEDPIPQDLVGTWNEQDKAAGMAWSYTFNQDGSYSYTLNGKAEVGAFSVSGDVLTLQPTQSDVDPSLNVRVYAWAVTQPTNIEPYYTLRLQDANGNNSNMIRAE